jgi:hypothetical protein
MRTVVLTCVAVAVFGANAGANVGVFFGSGKTIELIKSRDVQLVSEEVTISPRCAAVKELDGVEYRCQFVLKNRSQASVKVRVGFPLDREVHGATIPSATDTVLSYHFIARDGENTYHVQYVSGGGDSGKYKELFLWDMAFAAGETKVLHVGYILPMSMTMALTNKDKEQFVRLRYEKPWHRTLEACCVEHFHYITETGRSWAGPIEKAVFRVETGGFEWCLDRRPGIPGSDLARFAAQLDPVSFLRLMDAPEKTIKDLFPETKFVATVYREVSPDGWKYKSESEVTAWEFRDFQPGSPLRFHYYFVMIPEDGADCDAWARLVLGAKPKNTEVMELREIAAAFYGIAPRTESPKKFVEKQIWYHPKKGLRDSELSEKRQAALKRLDAIAKEKE